MISIAEKYRGDDGIYGNGTVSMQRIFRGSVRSICTARNTEEVQTVQAKTQADGTRTEGALFRWYLLDLPLKLTEYTKDGRFGT